MALGVLVALAGPWLLPTFMSAADPQTADVVEIGIVLLWIAAGYQIFDGLNLGSGFSLRGAGDVKVPAVLFFVCAWGVFVPHELTWVLEQVEKPAEAPRFREIAHLGELPALIQAIGR